MQGFPCTSPLHACSRSSSYLAWSKLAVLASRFLKRISWEAAKSRGPKPQHFLTQMKFPPRVCFNGSWDDCIFFLLSRTDVGTFPCIYEEVSLIDTAISQKVCKQRYTQRCRESYSKISHIHTCTYTSCKTPSSSVWPPLIMFVTRFLQLKHVGCLFQIF